MKNTLVLTVPLLLAAFASLSTGNNHSSRRVTTFFQFTKIVNFGFRSRCWSKAYSSAQSWEQNFLHCWWRETGEYWRSKNALQMWRRLGLQFHVHSRRSSGRKLKVFASVLDWRRQSCQIKLRVMPWWTNHSNVHNKIKVLLFYWICINYC